jgi:glyoxylase-like metal-dependent hydrolase (beta-lactamase superfamily II)
VARVDLVERLPRLYLLRMPVGHAYLWREADGLTLIDAGAPGVAPRIAEAIRSLGHRPTDLRRLILTHAHVDHVGSAREIAAWGDVTVLAHRADAPVIRGRAALPAPRLTDWEKPIFERANAQLPPGPPAPVRVDRELVDGDTIGFGGGAVVLAVPGHTPGSIAIHLPDARVLFTGDTLARDPRSRDPRAPVIPGVFNVDAAVLAESIGRLAAVDAEVACFGHGEPVTGQASAWIRETVSAMRRTSARR